MTPASRKNRARRPRMAKMLEVYTMNGSRVIARIAGTESTANMMSVVSITISTGTSAVATRLPFRRTKKLCES